MAYGGYYQARVRPGLRVISLNSNYFTKSAQTRSHIARWRIQPMTMLTRFCFFSWCSDNFWLLANQTDAVDQLNWAADVLRQMVELDEKAIVICHAPIILWNTGLATAFLAIAEQYQSTIVNFFMGHTHYNQYATLHSSAGVPMHVAYVGGSVVPYSGVNPGFLSYEYNRSAVFHADPYPYLVESAFGYWLDLAEANALNNTDAQWSIVRYDMAVALGVPSLDAATLVALAPNYLTNATLYHTYSTAMYKGLPNARPYPPKSVQCGTTCNTDAEYHTCMHAGGVEEAHIQAAEAEAKVNC
jgi:hypothetical protein